MLASSVPDDYVFSPPRFLGEVGWDVSGVVVNHDTCVYQERVNLLYESGVFDWLRKRLSQKGALRILEIGGGYGALAHQIKILFPHCNYWICDLPESLLFSALYLSLNLPDHKAGFGEEAPHGFTFLPNYMLYKLKGEFDLVVNTLSFSEFSEFQLRFYLEKIRDIIKDGILFEQNTDARHLGLLCAEDIIREYFDVSRVIKLRSARRTSEGTSHVWSNKPLMLEPLRLVPRLISPATLEATFVVSLQDLAWWGWQRLKRLGLVNPRLS